jgi:crotonobetainyl-CoA:carnitine CoA-transferase CaiB-like acyl-CoA transferase/acyl dehydratase
MKLEGLKVIDLSVFLPGPYLTMTLADHGAEVVKVEPPGGDPGRQIGLADGLATVFFRNVNRGKKSVVIDLKAADGRAQLLERVRGADVFVESYRPGVMQRLGFDYATVSAINPGIVYCSISAFGQDGPYRDRPAHDLATMALSGALSITLGSDGTPAMPGVAVADIVSSLHALSGILMALYRREKTGAGDYIDVAMHHAALAALPNVMGPAMCRKPQPNPKHERTTGGSAFYQVYETSDGRHVVLGAQEIKFVRNLLGRLERTDLVPLCERGPGLHQQPVISFLSSVFKEQPLAHWRAWFEDMDVSFAPVNSLREALDDPNVQTRGIVVEDSQGREHVAPVVRFLKEPAKPEFRAPAIGEHDAAFSSSIAKRTDGDGMYGMQRIGPNRYRENIGRTFADFVVGDVYEHRPGRTITEADNVWFTLLTMNTHPLHFDRVYAEETEFKKPLVNSCLTLAIVTGMSVSDISQKAIANLGWSNIKLTGPVFVGDTIYAESEVLAKRESKSRPGQGVVTVRTRGLKADGSVFMEFERSVLLPT